LLEIFSPVLEVPVMAWTFDRNADRWKLSGCSEEEKGIALRR
jgi:hypothetical protein